MWLVLARQPSNISHMAHAKHASKVLNHNHREDAAPAVYAVLGLALWGTGSMPMLAAGYLLQTIPTSLACQCLWTKPALHGLGYLGQACLSPCAHNASESEVQLMMTLLLLLLATKLTIPPTCRETLTALGPSFIKPEQMLASRCRTIAFPA